MNAVATRSPGHAEHFALAQQALGFVTWIWDTSSDRVEWFGDLSPLLGLVPGSFPGKAGWRLTTRSGNQPRKFIVRMRIHPASTTKSGPKPATTSASRAS